MLNSTRSVSVAKRNNEALFKQGSEISVRHSVPEHDDNGDYVLIRVIERNNDPKGPMYMYRTK